jgi:hypothetical protein
MPKEILKRKQPIQPIRTQGDGSTSQTPNDEINIDLDLYLLKSYISVPFVELMKVPSLKKKAGKVLGFVDDDPSQDQPIVLQTTDRGGFNGKNDPFYISLGINDLILHNCMLDTGASTNVMPLSVMKQLGLKTTQDLIEHVCAMDAREVKVYGVIKNLLVYLVVEPDIKILMDIVVIDVLDSWGMLLSRKFSNALS